jgi:hypothetical protein
MIGSFEEDEKTQIQGENLEDTCCLSGHTLSRTLAQCAVKDHQSRISS